MQNETLKRIQEKDRTKKERRAKRKELMVGYGYCDARNLFGSSELTVHVCVIDDHQTSVQEQVKQQFAEQRKEKKLARKREKELEVAAQQTKVAVASAGSKPKPAASAVVRSPTSILKHSASKPAAQTQEVTPNCKSKRRVSFGKQWSQ